MAEEVPNMWSPAPDHPLRRLFAGLTEQTFITTLGVADPALTDYLSSLLSRFIHLDALYRLRNACGKRLEEVAEMLIEAEALPEGPTRREVHRHIGDFALFWTGVYPEALNRVRSPRCKDHFVDYTVQGKRGYLMTSRLDEGERPDEAGLFRRLSEQFEVCAIGLREVRREWEELRHDPPGGLIK